MKKVLFFVLLYLTVISSVNAQIVAPKFGSGLRISAQDSSFYMKIGLRFQTLYQSSWNLPGDKLSDATDRSSAIFIRRSRLKFSGWALNPKLKYKCELALSNRDNGGGNSSYFSNAANIILDASVSYNFYKGFTIWVGQGKMAGNRERIISSGNLQFVDRSRLNSRFNLDRDVGVMLLNKHKLSETFILKETLTFSSGEGKNITTGNIGGNAYTFKIEAFPFGDFQSNGAYIGSSIKRETEPKLAIAAAYDVNEDAGRTRGQLGSFLIDNDGIAYGKDLKTFFVDMMFKYQGWSVMAEYVDRQTEDDISSVFNDSEELIGTYYTGSATNLAVGYMMKNNLEIAARWTDVKPNEDVASEETQYTVGLSKFIVGHKLKVQLDLTYREIDLSDDDLIFRMQLDLHF